MAHVTLFRRITLAAVVVALTALLADRAISPQVASSSDPALSAQAPDPAQVELRVAFLGRLMRGGRGACLTERDIRDRDVLRNALTIRDAGLCVTQDTFSENGIDWRFTAISNPDARGPVWYLPHDNESEAFDAAVYAVSRYGGQLVAIDGGEGRNYRGIDPNRYFAVTAAEAGPCAMRRPAPRYTKYVMGLFKGRRHILSMHNNTRGGGVSVSMSSAKAKGFRTGGRFSDPDHMVFIASKGSIDGDSRGRATRQKLLNAGLNVVHEAVSPQNSDCSFSNYVALNDRREYFNIEAVHGSSDQKAMVDALMGALGYRPAR
ncbi:MAG: hypothetical protein AcusKO_31550 [Acuticoccus sp.]